MLPIKFGGDVPFENCLWHFKIVLTQIHTGLEISNCYSSYSFQQISAKLHDKYLGNGKTPVQLFHDLTIYKSFKTIITL